jgi:thiol-disulfide isomerase/thioredoxin
VTRTAWLVAGAAAVVAAVVLAPFFSKPTQPGGPAGLAGRPAPAIGLADAAGANVSLAQLRGKIAVVNLWASWCPPCRAEMPDLQRLAGRYAARGVVVVGINQGESPERASAYARSLGISFPIWIDERQQYGRAFSALGLPTTVIVGRDGIVARGFDGALTYDEMQRAIGDLLEAP